MSFFNDTFTGADATNIISGHTSDSGDSWVVHAAAFGGASATIFSNTCRPNVNNFVLINPDIVAPSADYSVLSRIKRITTDADTSNGSGIAIRLSSSASLTCYLFRVRTDRMVLEKYVSGSGTNLGTRMITVAQNDEFDVELLADGSTIEVYVFDVANSLWITASGTDVSKTALFSVTDSSVTAAGTPGIAAYRNYFTFDNYQALEAGVLHPSGEDFLALTDEVEAILRTTERPEQFLNFVTSAVGYRGTPWLPIEISQTLDLVQSVKNTWFGQGSSDLGLVQTVDFSYALENTLELEGVATGGINYNLFNEMELTDSSTRGGSMWNRTASSSLTLQSHANSYNPNNKCDRRYGARTGPVASGKLTLRSVDGLHEIELRNPQVDNGRRTSFERILRETRGGSLIVYRDASWPVTQTLQFTIISTKTATLVSLRQFFLDTLGYEIQLIDWLGEEWLGVVIRPDEPFVEDGEGYWTFGFEFEGHKVGGHSGSHNLSLSSEVSFVLE